MTLLSGLGRTGKLIKPQPPRGGAGKLRVSQEEIAELPTLLTFANQEECHEYARKEFHLIP